jgi:hypothetical protein
MIMEFRARITVEGLPFDNEDRWTPIIDALQRDPGDFGPIISWTDNVAHFVLSADADDHAAAADTMTHAVAEALRDAGAADLYPSHVEIEPADELEHAAA